MALARLLRKREVCGIRGKDGGNRARFGIQMERVARLLEVQLDTPRLEGTFFKPAYLSVPQVQERPRLACEVLHPRGTVLSPQWAQGKSEVAAAVVLLTRLWELRWSPKSPVAAIRLEESNRAAAKRAERRNSDIDDWQVLRQPTQCVLLSLVERVP